MGQPRGAREISAQVQAVAEAGQRAVALGLDQARALNAEFGRARLRPGSLMRRLLQDIGTRLDPRTGVAAIGSLAGMGPGVWGPAGSWVEPRRRAKPSPRTNVVAHDRTDASRMTSSTAQ